MHGMFRGEIDRGLPQKAGIKDVNFPPEWTVRGLVRRLIGDIEDVVSFRPKSIDHMGPNESRTAGDENSSH
jgi:hypothetical protein